MIGPSYRPFSLLGMVLAGPLLAGCGGGPEFYTVSGTVTFRGAPLPAGEIRFAPDARRGNEGPAVVARMRPSWLIFMSGGNAPGATGSPCEKNRP